MDIVNRPLESVSTYSDTTLLLDTAKSAIENELLLKLQSKIGEEAPCISDIAKSLGFSERTLRRKLKKEGTGFRQLLEEVRKRRAIDFLGKLELTLIDISLLLGYKEQSTFNHAFRDWYNESPGQYRKRLSVELCAGTTPQKK